MKSRRLSLIALGVACIATVTACSSSSKSSSPAANSAPAANATPVASTGSSAGVAAAQAAVQAAETVPSTIPETVALPHAPAPGTKVAFLTCSATACSLLNPGFMAAAQALGWKPTVITYNTATPGQALQQAIDAGNKYIATTSIELSEITPQLQEAKAKGIAVFGAYTPDTPQGAGNGLYGVAQDITASGVAGKLLPEWMVADSGGHAHAVYVTIPIYPSLNAGQTVAQQVFKQQCPGCSLGVLPLSLTQVGSGQTPSAVVSYLQAHPNTNYVYLSFQDLFPGLVSALKTAGLAGKVKIVGQEAQQPELQSLIDGTSSAWSILPEPYVMWVVVDWMARLAVGMHLTPDIVAAGDNPEAFLVTNASQAQAQLAQSGGNWPGPTNYQQQFKALWKVG
jgi:ABC-type sugar transport system substrate-binding protein